MRLAYITDEATQDLRQAAELAKQIDQDRQTFKYQ